MPTAREITPEELAAFRAAARRREGAAGLIPGYAVLASRIRHDLAEIEQVVDHAERALVAADRNDGHSELFLDSAALSLHNFSSGVERLLKQIASTDDRRVPATHNVDGEHLHQTTMDLPRLRPQVLAERVAADLDEYRRFRHVLRNVRAFELDPERVQQLTSQLRPAFLQARAELEAFADVLQALSDQA